MTPDIKSRIDALTPDAGLQHVPAKAGQAEEFHTLVRRSDMHAAIEAVLGARSTAAQPAGWMLVPIEPTADMRNAFHAVTDGDVTVQGAAGSRWAAMLAAAPPAAAQPVERAVALLREAVTTLDMWADVAPAVSLRHDINRFLGSVAAASGDSTPPSEPAHSEIVQQMALALREARACIMIDRTSVADCHTAPDGSVDEDGAAALEDYDDTIAQIDAAIAAQGDPSGALRPEPEAVGHGSVEGDVRALRQMVADCEVYLKEGETPAQRIERERRDTEAVLNLLIREKQRTEAMREVMLRMMAGIDHLAEIARQWEPDHSSGADRRGWVLAKDARDDAAMLLQPDPPQASGERGD